MAKRAVWMARPSSAVGSRERAKETARKKDKVAYTCCGHGPQEFSMRISLIVRLERFKEKPNKHQANKKSTRLSTPWCKGLLDNKQQTNSQKTTFSFFTTAVLKCIQQYKEKKNLYVSTFSTSQDRLEKINKELLSLLFGGIGYRSTYVAHLHD